MSDTPEYTYPSEDELLLNFIQQKHGIHFFFAGRGMNDNALKYLASCLSSETNLDSKHLDIRRNFLTNKSLPYLQDLFDKGCKIDASENNFDYDSKYETLLKSIITRPSGKKTSDYKIFHHEDDDSDSDVTNEDYSDVTNEEDLDATNDSNSDASDISDLYATDNERRQNTSLEYAVMQSICNEHPIFKIVPRNEVKGCVFAEQKRKVVLSDDNRTVLLIAEVDREVTPKTLIRLKARLAAFEESKNLQALPSKLKNVESIVGVIGGRKIDDKFREYAIKQAYLIVLVESKFQIVDLRKAQELLRGQSDS